MDTPELNAEAAEQQDDRYMSDPWEPRVEKWLTGRFGEKPKAEAAVTTADVLEFALDK